VNPPLNEVIVLGIGGTRLGHRFGISGSTIMTDPDLLEDLFWGDIEHVEIGEFPDEESFLAFLTLKNEKGVSFGVHSPILRSGSKYDLIEKVQYDPEEAWHMFEQEVSRLAELGAEYVLVHFPYFKDEVSGDPMKLIEDGLKRLSRLQSQYNIPIVCEPKLGMWRSKAGINYLHQFPIEVWTKYGLHLCIDIGDYAIATGENILEYIGKWKDYIKVVHLHNVEFVDDKYLWIPIHPSFEKDGSHFKIKQVVQRLSESKDVYFVLEHTPHLNPGQVFVEEGADWLKSLLTEE
jgi:sugar phosphate isomerase/epimerase